MKLFEAYEAAEALKKLTTLHFGSFAVARSVAKLSTKVKEEAQFYLAEEVKLVNQYSKKNENGEPVIEGSMVMFDKPENRQAYLEEVTKLRELEIEVEKVKITQDAFINPEEIPTPEEILKLDSVIDWE